MEIGSEFSAVDILDGKESVINLNVEYECLVFSGRTAIETVLNNELNIHKAYLPSYCCDSMIEPFRRAGIKVDFYKIEYDNGLKVEFDIPLDVDCIIWNNYFGFTIPMPDMSEFITRGGVVIEDITHSLYSRRHSHEQSHYLVASLRKWEPVLCGGFCISKRKKLHYIPKRKPPEKFLTLRNDAMNLKNRYLAGEYSVEKDKFLRMFSEANQWLAENYSDFSIDSYSKKLLGFVDYEMHRRKRIINAQILYNGLKDNSDIEFLFPLGDMDCPLFVPIIVQNNKRDIIREKLKKNDIYCPIHWPHPNADCTSNLYELELSLICDHRYGEDDMKRIISVLND